MNIPSDEEVIAMMKEAIRLALNITVYPDKIKTKGFFSDEGIRRVYGGKNNSRNGDYS
jgi:hypothetical protein